MKMESKDRVENPYKRRGFVMIMFAALLITYLIGYITPYTEVLLVLAIIFFLSGSFLILRGGRLSPSMQRVVGIISGCLMAIIALYVAIYWEGPLPTDDISTPDFFVSKSSAEGMIFCPPTEPLLRSLMEISLQKGFMNFTIDGVCFNGFIEEEIGSMGITLSSDPFTCSRCNFPGYKVCDIEEVYFHCYNNSEFCSGVYPFVQIGGYNVRTIKSNPSGEFFEVHVSCSTKDNGKLRCDLYLEGVAKPEKLEAFNEFLGYDGGVPIYSEVDILDYAMWGMEKSDLFYALCDDDYSGASWIYESSGVNVSEKQSLFRDILKERWIGKSMELERELTSEELEFIIGDIASNLSIKTTNEIVFGA